MSCTKKGFSVIELMIVVMILGFLLAVAIPSFLAARSATRARACQKNLTVMYEAKHQWAIEMNQPFFAEMDWEDLVGEDLYIRHQPECPAGGEYELGSMLELPVCSIGEGTGRHPHVIDPPLPGTQEE